MRILLLSARDDYHATQRFSEAFNKRGHKVTRVDPAKIDLGPGYAGKAMRITGSTPGSFDLCLPRLSRTRLAHTFRVLKVLEESGTLLMNPVSGLMAARDKFETFRVLRQAGLPTPDTTLVSDPDSVEAAARSVGGFPVVAKPVHGTQGSGVTLVEDAISARTLVESAAASGEAIVFQKYIDQARGGDVRLITVGARVVGAVRRVPAEGDFRANLHQGGTPQRFRPNDPLRDLATRAANDFGLRFAGIDVLLDARNPQILEVNASPGFQGFEDITGLEVAETVVVMAERIVAAP